MTDPAAGLDDLAAALAATSQADAAVRLSPKLAEWTDLLADELAASARQDPATIRPLAARLVARLAREHGGTFIYIPKGGALTRALRNLRLWADFDGTLGGPRGIEALARREGLGMHEIYRILAAQRQQHRAQRQGELFGEGDLPPSADLATTKRG